jgi:hypothetical protein
VRTRLVRPEFWADSRMADLPDTTRLTYIGLWCLADDDGYIVWSVRDIAAELYRYEAPLRREKRVTRQMAELVTAERVEVLDCGLHAVIPSIPKYRIKGGNQTRQHHQVQTGTCSVRTSTDKYLSVSVSDSGTSSVSESLSGSSSVTGAGSSRAREKTGSKNPETRETNEYHLPPHLRVVVQ